MTAGQLNIECLSWRSFERNTLKGFADFYISAVGLSIKDCAVHERNGKAWVQLPAKPRLDKDGNPVRDPESGKLEYFKILSFDARADADDFRDAAVAALAKREPGALTIQKEAEECLPLLS